MATRATKLRASVCKSQVADANSHFVEQRDALLSIYDCAMVFTETDAKYTLHVQRDNGRKLSSSVMQQALSDNYDPPTRYTHVTGDVLRKSGEIREHGGASRGVAVKAGRGCGKKKDDRYIEFKLREIGEEELEAITREGVANALVGGFFYDTIRTFGHHVQHATVSNHNFSCFPRDGIAKYLPNGAPYFISAPKKEVCRVVFMNWVKKLAEMISEHEAELEQEPVTKFRQQMQDYMEMVEYDSHEVAAHEKKVVQSVSETAKSMRTEHEQSCGKKIKLVV